MTHTLSLTWRLALFAAGIAATLTTVPARSAAQSGNVLPYPIVDTGQGSCFDGQRAVTCPSSGAAYFGQDAQYRGRRPTYADNGDGTVFDVNTGLTWQQGLGPKVTHAGAIAGATTLKLGGYTDWRLPTIKELYSLILFDGTDVSPCMNGSGCTAVPFLDAGFFTFRYGDPTAGERVIDAQYWSSTTYVSTTMGTAPTAFGVNFADGRIKGYPTSTGPNGSPFTAYVRYVRGNADYGRNVFVDRNNGTVDDQATGLTWTIADSGAGLDWPSALAYCENLTTAGFGDWRLPDAKELQSLVDYRRSPTTTNSAAIDPLFWVTPIRNEAGQADYPSFWTSTTHAASTGDGRWAAYVAFGRAMGYMNATWTDVHGAGAQRSDPKTGDPDAYPTGHGPQGDAVRIVNFARCVRSGGVSPNPAGGPITNRAPVIVGGDQPGPGTPGPTPPAPGGDGRLPSGQPPQEAVAACAGKAQGTACSFTAPPGLVTGTCRTVATALACVPAGGPPQR